MEKMIALLHLHPCYMVNFYKLRSIDTSFLMDLTKGLYIDLAGSKRQRLLAVSLAQRIFLADIEAKADVFNDRSYFWQLFDLVLEASDKNILFLAIIMGQLIK